MSQQVEYFHLWFFSNSSKNPFKLKQFLVHRRRTPFKSMQFPVIFDPYLLSHIVCHFDETRKWAFPNFWEFQWQQGIADSRVQIFTRNADIIYLRI